MPSHSFFLPRSVRAQLLQELSETQEEAQEVALKLSLRCAAVRSELETHIRAEETEIWPLFAEHFTVEEQHRIVGHVIGRTGAEVLQMMLPWVSSCITEEEKQAMMHSLHSASKKTRFEKWMQHSSSDGGGHQRDAVEASPQPSVSAALSDVASYLLQSGWRDAELGEFCPSLKDMFRLNQRQLEAAVRHVSSDPSLEPQRKSYLIQWILVSKYITQHPSHHDPKPNRPHFVSYASEAEGVFGCAHYRRNCALVAPCCGEVYVCRLCHDAEQDHKLDRYSVEEIVCMACGTRQGVTNRCQSCHIIMARYHCAICRLYDNDPDKDIYHCPFCNVCRRGKGLGTATRGKRH